MKRAPSIALRLALGLTLGMALLWISAAAISVSVMQHELDEARDETSAKFVGPVAKRAKGYIERLLPGCELRFSEDLQLEAVERAGVSEGCEDLSHGTQEQLAVLTRISRLLVSPFRRTKRAKQRAPLPHCDTSLPSALKIR